MHGLNEGTAVFWQLAGVVIAGGILILLKWRRLMTTARDWFHYKWQDILETFGKQIVHRFHAFGTEIEPDMATIAGTAMKHPPKSIDYALRTIGARKYVMPLGWWVAHGKLDLVKASLAGDDVYHMLVSAKSRMGKDNAVIYWLLSLALQNKPELLQLAIVDGKGGLDWQGFENKAHTSLLAVEDEDIVPAMQLLTAERKRRGALLKEARVSNWESYIQKGNTMPLLLVYISELSLLESATSSKELSSWMEQELSSAAAFGMRYIIATQTATNFNTRWRGQIDLFIAGYQPASSHDAPNTGLSTKELKEQGVIPPSELPGPPDGRGVFTLVQGRDAATVRVPYLDDEVRQSYLDRLPNGPQNPLEKMVKIKESRLPASVNAETRFSASESDFTSSDFPFSSIEIAQIAVMIGAGKSKTEVIKAMPRYSGRRHTEFSKWYEQIKDMTEKQTTL